MALRTPARSPGAIPWAGTAIMSELTIVPVTVPEAGHAGLFPPPAEECHDAPRPPSLPEVDVRDCGRATESRIAEPVRDRGTAAIDRSAELSGAGAVDGRGLLVTS